VLNIPERVLPMGSGNLLNTSGLSISGSTNTLVIFPAGFNTATQALSSRMQAVPEPGAATGLGER